MIVVVLSMSGEDGALVSGPDIITRGFVYVKESEGLMEELRQVALEAIQSVDGRYATDWSAIKGAIKGDLSNYLYKKTKRSPMILPVIKMCIRDRLMTALFLPPPLTSYA